MQDIIDLMMKKSIKTYITSVLLSLLALSSVAQNKFGEFPIEEQPIADHEFTDLMNTDQKSFKISDYRGKWLVLDFWSRGCSGCIASFPKINKLDEQFKNKVKIVMVGLTHNTGTTSDDKLTKAIFTSRMGPYGLKFTMAFDSLAGKKYGIHGVPAIFVINPEGIVVATAIKLDSTQLSEFIAGRIPKYEKNWGSQLRPVLNPRLPLLTNGKKANGGIDTSFLARSILSVWNPEMGYKVEGLNIHGPNGYIPGKVTLTGVDLPTLFRLAYTGKVIWGDNDSLYYTFSRKVLVRNVDTALFQMNDKGRTTENSYAYSLTIPQNIATLKRTKEYFFTDLHRYFGLTSHIELIPTDVYFLVVKDKKKVSKLKNRSGIFNIIGFTDRPGYKFTNISLTDFLVKSHLQECMEESSDFVFANQLSVIDKTGIDYKIDVVFDGDWRDMKQALGILHKNGFDLVKGKVDMKTIVVESVSK